MHQEQWRRETVYVSTPGISLRMASLSPSNNLVDHLALRPQPCPIIVFLSVSQILFLRGESIWLIMYFLR
jgi:hypothetical protein